jgi:hypothetical protein
MFLIRLNKLVSPAIAYRTGLTARGWLYSKVRERSAEFCDKIASGFSSNKALYANEYSELFRQ